VARWELRNSDVHTVSAALIPSRIQLGKGLAVSIYS